jgi:transposase InsO family protein
MEVITKCKDCQFF